jgi:uncharacterized membrane protein
MNFTTNFPHWHLLLNHFPIIGTMVGLALLLLSFVGNNEDLRRSSYIVLAGIALLSIPTFLTGVAAEPSVQNQPGVSDLIIQRHEGSAMLSIWFMLATGAFALVGLWQSRDKSGPSRLNVGIVLILSLLTMGLMARTGNTGGDIRHSEVRGNQNPTVKEDAIGSILYAFEPTPEKFTQLMTINDWWWGFLMGVHFMGLALIIGTVGVLDVRIMGFIKQVPFAPLHRFLPWAMIGLGVNILTGLMAFIGQPMNYIYSVSFWLKMIVLMLLGLNAAVFYLTNIFPEVEHLGAGEDAPMSAKLVAASSLILCFGLVVFGRYIQPLADTIHNTFN